MLKVRLIPVLLLKSGMLVRSERFTTHQIIGNPFHEVRRFNEWQVDELIYLDITRADETGGHRRDVKIRSVSDPLAVLDEVSRTCFMPLTFGGRIRSVEDMRLRLLRGADKVTVNTGAILDPKLIPAGAQAFGSQAIVVSIDVLHSPGGRRCVMTNNGNTATGLDPLDWARRARDSGAGEILLQSIERDGTATGYDIDLIHDVASAVDIPVIALSGAGTYDHYAEAVQAGASAVAAANLWHFKDLADRNGKRSMQAAGIDVRF